MAAAIAAGEDVEMEQNTLIVTRGDAVLSIRFVDFREIRGVITGPIESITVRTMPIENELPGAGEVQVSVGANLYSVPFGAQIHTSVSTGPSLAETQELLASLPDAPYPAAVAYAIDVATMNLVNGEDIGTASMTIVMDAAWVNDHGGANSLRIVHIGNDGNVEVIVPTVRCEGTTVHIEADSPAGFSSFVLIAAGEPPVGDSFPDTGQVPEPTSAGENTEPAQTPFPALAGLAGAGLALSWWSGRYGSKKN